MSDTSKTTTTSTENISQIAATINEIIKQRQKLAKDIETKAQQVESVATALTRCNDLLGKTLRSLDVSDARYSVFTARQTDISGQIVAANERSRELHELRKRFKRSKLVIGVIGEAAAGKSTLLQKITGLDNKVIKTHASKHCTGAIMTFEHNESTPLGMALADINFHNEQDYLDQVIIPFYSDFGKRDDTPETLDSFLASSDIVVPDSQGDKEKLFNLIKCNLRGHRHYLRDGVEKSVSADQINAFTGKCDDSNNEISLWTMVKSAEVRCCFPSLSSAGAVGISVVDTPGLGDRTTTETESSLQQNIKDTVDALIILRKIADSTAVRGVHKREVAFCESLEYTVGLPKEQWLYTVYNHISDVPQHLVDALISDYTNSTLRNIPHFVVNCNDNVAVLEVFETILQAIQIKQPNLDQILASKQLEATQATIVNITALARELKEIIPKVSEESPGGDFLGGEVLAKELSIKLAAVVATYDEHRKSDDEKFKTQIKKLGKNLFNIDDNQTTDIPPMVVGVPTVDKIRREGNISPGDFFDETCRGIRRNIVTEFYSLDATLGEAFNILREEARKAIENPCLCTEIRDEEDTQPLMSSVFSVVDVANMRDIRQKALEQYNWWKELANIIENADYNVQVSTHEDSISEDTCDVETTKLKKAAELTAKTLRRFGEATLSVHSFLLPRILPCFDVLDRDKNESKPYRFHTAPQNDEDREELRRYIDAAAKSGIDKAIKLCETFAKEPPQALWAAIVDLQDAVARTGGLDTARDIWSRYYRKHCVMTPKQLEEIENRVQWHTAVNTLEQAVVTAHH